MAAFDFFKPRQPQQPVNNNQQNQNQNQPQNNNGQNNQNNNQNNNPDPNNPQQNNLNPGNGNNQNANPNEPANPLDVYGKMFDNPTNNDDTPPSFNIDPKIMDQVVGSQDFMRGINPDLLQKATSGDTQSLLEIIQHTSRNAYRSAIEHGGVLTDKFVGARESYGNKKLPDVLRGHLTEQQLAANTPNYKHPVVKQQLSDIARRLQKTHPDAQPQEIAEMAKDYLQTFMKAITPAEQNPVANKPKETDWDQFFDDDQT